MKTQNKNREIKVEKVTLNIGVGEPGDKLDKALKLLTKISGMKPIKTKTFKRIPTWGLRPNLHIGAKVTVRKKKAEDLLIRLLKAIDNKLSIDKLDESGNFSFGIKEYLDIPQIEYDIEIGIIGLEVAVTLARPGFRVKKRKLKRSRIPMRHKITKEDALNFIRNRFNVLIEEEVITA